MTTALGTVPRALFGKTSAAGVFLLIVASWLVFAIAGTGFLGGFNLFSLSQTAGIDIVIGFSQMVMLVVARMNLAVGAVGVVVVMLSGFLLSSVGLPLLLVLLVALIVGALAGCVMGLIEIRSGLSSFIVTLAMLSVLEGAMLILTKAHGFGNLPSSLSTFGNGFAITSYVSWLLVVAAVVGALLWCMYARTTLGWKLLAVGANERAALLSGVRASRMVLTSYALSGVLAAVAGIMTMAKNNAALPSTGGTDWLLPSFIGPVLGGVALTGGQVSVLGAFLGAVFYDGIASGLVILNVSTDWLQLAQGAVLLGAVVLDQLRRARNPAARAMSAT